MNSSKSSEEVLAELKASMGNELGNVFHLLDKDLTWLCWRWNEYIELFATKESRIEIINRSAPFFFYVIQQMLLDDTLLAISRLAGPAHTGNHPNLAICCILPLIKNHNLKSEVERLIQSMDDACGFVIPWRNKHLAHRDFKIAMEPHVNALPEVTREKIDKAIDSITDVMNHVNNAYQNSTTAYRFINVDQGAESLLFTLRDGLKRKELRQAKLEAGEYTHEDWDDQLPPV